MKTPTIDGATLRERLAAPEGAKGPPDLKSPAAVDRALGASFGALLAMPLHFLSDEHELVFRSPLSAFGLRGWGHWRNRQGVTKRYHACLETLAMLGRLP